MMDGLDRHDRGAAPTDVRRRWPTAFTLIELLIVVAIIAILAAIAVPNFLEAQIRAKVTRTLADMRSLSVAIESYRIDADALPALQNGDPLADWLMVQGNLGNPYTGNLRHVGELLTTPIAYIGSIPMDIFMSEMGRRGGSFEWSGLGRDVSVVFVNFTLPSAGFVDITPVEWFKTLFWPPYDLPGELTYHMSTCGPDLRWWNVSPGEKIYDPTNGTVSAGDIWAFDNSRIFPPR